jgi:PAS domain S-box-containing protein
VAGDRAQLTRDPRLAVLASALPVGIFQTNLEGRCLYVSERVSELTGLSVEQARQFGWEQCVHPDDRAAVSRDLRAALLAGEPRQVECRCVLPDGNIRWLLCQSTPEFDAQGRLVGCIGTLLDSTDTREALRASEERFRLTAESANVGMLDYDVAADRGLWSPVLCSLLGIPVGGLITLARGFDFCHPEDRARVERAMAAALDPKGSGTFAEEFRIRRADTGESRWLACTCRTHFTGAGDSRRAMRFTGVVTDISERKGREEHDEIVSRLVTTWVRARDTPTLVRIVTDAISSHLNVSHVFVGAIPPDRSERAWTVADDLSDAARAHLVAGRPLVVNDTAADMRTASPRYDANGVRALIVVPILGDGELRAVLAVATPDVRTWRLDEVQLLQHVATRLWPKMARVRAEEALRRSEERQAFLLMLSDALRPLSDPLDVQETAARLLGEHLLVNRVGYAEIEDHKYIVRREYASGVPPLVGQGPVGTFGSALRDAYRRGDTVVVNDVRTDPRFTELERVSLQERQIVAMVGVMLLKGGRLLAAFGANNATPRLWTPTEVALVHDVAERTWAAVERARAEAALREREQRLRVALDASGGGSWTWDVRSNQLDWDEAFRALYGFTRDEPPAPEKWMAGVHEEDRPQVQGLLERVLRTATLDAWDNTFRFVRPDGTVLWMQSRGRADRDAAGAVTRLTGLDLDITEQRRADEALQARRDEERDRELRLLLETASQGIVSVDERGTIVMANHALEWMFGWAHGELIGQPLERLVPKSLRDTHVQHRTQYFGAARSGPMGVDMDLVGLRHDGSTFPIEVILNHVATPAGARVLAFVTDITARKRAAAALRERTRELEHRTAQLSRLASDLTLAEQRAREALAKTLHDGLQQLLVSAALNVERQVTRDAQQGAAVSEPLQQAKRHLDDAIAAARSLSFELFPPVLHASGLPDALTWLGERIAHEYGLVVQVSADPRANSERKDVRILLFESVRELLFNAVKHAQVDRVAVDLVLQPDNTLCITVSDKGIGFDPTGLVHRTKAGHVGWGLFSIRERLTLLGGRFDIDSAPQRGTQFRLIAPRGLPEAVAIESKPAAVASRAPLRALRILIVDDHAGVREAFREMLEERPELQVVGEAADGLEAIAKAHELRPDVILMDVSMPVMDGVQATRRVRAELPFIQVLGLSTYTRADAQAIELAGAAGFYSKAVDAQRLIDHLITLHATTAHV